MRYLVLLNNPYIYDTRVERLIHFLSRKKNNEILLLCTHKKGLRKKVIHKNVTILRVPYSSKIYTLSVMKIDGQNEKIKSFFLKLRICISRIIEIITLPLKIFIYLVNIIVTALQLYLDEMSKVVLESFSMIRNPFKKINKIFIYLFGPFKFIVWIIELIVYIIALPILLLVDVFSTFINTTITIIDQMINYICQLHFFNSFKKISFKSFTFLLYKTLFSLKTKLQFFELDIYSTLFKKEGIKFNPDFIHANDLATLKAGYDIKNETNAKLVYDSHELEMDKNKKFPYLVQIKRRQSENKFIKKSDEVITVSESIANFLKKTYKIKKPIVVYNSPNFSKLKKIKRKLDLRKYLKIPKNSKIIVYVGLISVNRGIENAIQSMKYFDKDTYFLLIGPVNPTFNKIYLQDYFTF